MNTTITLPKNLFKEISKRAVEYKLSPEQFTVEFLTAQLLPQHPYVEIVKGAGSMRPVIKGTRTGVDSIVGYNRAGYSPQDIADEILPHLKLAEVYDALSYYEDHRVEMDQVMAANNPQLWQARIRQEMGTEDAKKFLGEG